MDGEGQHAHTPTLVLNDSSRSFQKHFTQPIQVGLVERVANKEQEHLRGTPFYGTRNPLLSFSPQTSLSSNNSELTPFTSTASEADIEDSSREDLYALEGSSGIDLDHSRFGSSLSALATGPPRRFEHASRTADLLEFETAMADSRSSSGHVPLHFAQQRGNENPDELYAPGNAVVQSRNGQQTGWSGRDNGFASAGG